MITAPMAGMVIEMIGFIKNWAINIVTLVLFITMMEMLLPKGRVKKYINLLTGTILIIAIVEPLTGIWGKGFDFSASQTMSAMNMDRIEIEKTGHMLEQEQIRQTVALYRGRIIEQIERQAREVEGVLDAEADVIINEDYNSESFGEIKRIYIQVYTEGGNNGQSAGSPENRGTSDGDRLSETDGMGKSASINTSVINKIGKIRVGNRNSDISDDRTNMGDADSSNLKTRITDRIEGVFGVSRDNIIISQLQR